MITISGTLTYVDSAGTRHPLINADGTGKTLYLRPSRTDFTYKVGMDWEPWTKLNANLPLGYQDCVQIITNPGSGGWSVSVPYTDTEVHLPAGAPSPALLWNIEFPEQREVYFGPLPSSLGATATLDSLLQGAWELAGATQYATWSGTERIITITFTSAAQEQAVAWNDIGGADWKFTSGVYTDDDDRVYVCNCKKGTKTNLGATFRLSDLPQVSKDVSVDLRIWR